MRSRTRNANRRGITVVEFALVALELFVVMFAIVDFARAALVYTGLANASRLAVRYAITHGSDRSQACASAGGCGSTDGTAANSDICGSAGVVANFAIGMNTANVSCTATGLGGGPGTTVKVTASYPYDPFFGFLPIKGIMLVSTSSGVVTY